MFGLPASPSPTTLGTEQPGAQRGDRNLRPGRRHHRLLPPTAERDPQAVAAYITSAYWFTASTSFANPAAALARALTDTFAGIRMADVPAFVAAELVGAALATSAMGWLFCFPPPWHRGVPAGTLDDFRGREVVVVEVIFACVHNAGRSQMAQAFFNALVCENSSMRISGAARRARNEAPHARVALLFRVFADRAQTGSASFTCSVAARSAWVTWSRVLRIPQARASRHLAYLRRTGLVQARKSGLWNAPLSRPGEEQRPPHPPGCSAVASGNYRNSRRREALLRRQQRRWLLPFLTSSPAALVAVVFACALSTANILLFGVGEPLTDAVAGHGWPSLDSRAADLSIATNRNRARGVLPAMAFSAYASARRRAG